ncbi:ABC transporter ATP-binding protein [Bradyrhizobium sp. McL0615]|uniref:ABC transporter ATP-binding protein n=1 Tax=Bradyrhizobium sp. McL0615 TaxID=3415673 RepID=UPI003CFA90F0
MIAKLARRLLGDLWHQFGWRAPALVFLIILASSFEGLAISLLLPLLSVLGITRGQEAHMSLFNAAFARFDLNMTLGTVVALISAIIALQYSLVIAQSWLSATVQSGYLRVLRQETFRRVMHADWPFLMKRSVGGLINFVTSETARAASAVYVIVQLVSAVVTAAIFVAIAVVLSWQLTFLLLIAAGLVAALLHPVLRWSRALGAETSVQHALSLGWLNEVFNGAKLIKATAAEEYVARRHNVIEDELARIQRGLLLQPHLLRVVFEATGILLLLGTLALATTLFGLEGGVVLTVVALFMRLYPRLGNLQHLVQQLFITLPAVENLERLNRELDSAQEIIGQPDNLLSQGDIDIRDVHLRYDQRPVLQGIDLHLAAGGHYAFVGRSGAGKTSLVDCLLGLIPSSKGDIRVGGVPMAEVGLANWRRSVGYVTQETVLFNMSVRDNIAWSNLEASDEMIEDAARRANAHEFIMANPKGYDAVIGDRGVMLSGGQRQRIGLARALLGNRALLILDEATSALDSDAEQSILDAIRALRGELTVIMIAHRLPTVRFCDRIFLIEEGRVVEAGGWSELISKNGRFSSLLEAQGMP